MSLIPSYLECEMKVGKVRTACGLQHVALEVNVRDFVHRQQFLLVHLLECVKVVAQLDKRNDPVAATAQVLSPLKVFHR